MSTACIDVPLLDHMEDESFEDTTMSEVFEMSSEMDKESAAYLTAMLRVTLQTHTDQITHISKALEDVQKECRSLREKHNRMLYLAIGAGSVIGWLAGSEGGLQAFLR